VNRRPAHTASERRIGRRAAIAGAAAALGATALGCSRRGAPPGRREASLWFSYGGRNRVVLEALVDRFNRSQNAFWMHAVYQGDYFEGLAKLRTAIAARAAPALSHVVGEVVPYLAEAGVLEHLDGYPGARALDFIPELGQERSWWGGGSKPLVALPFNRSTPIAYLNGKMFHDAGLDPPTSWTELRQVARALTKRVGDRVTRYGFGCPIDWWFWLALVGQAGGRVIDADGTLTLGGDAGVEAIELWQHMVQRDRSMKPPPGRDYNAWEATNQDYLAGRTAMIWTSTAFLRYLEQNAPFPVVTAALPAGVQRAVPTGGTFWVVPKQAPAEQKQTAWAFLCWMSAPSQVIEWAVQTGYLPTTRGAVRELERQGYYRMHPNARVALDQLRVAFPWPWSTRLFRVQREVVQPLLEKAVLENADARALLDHARAVAKRGA
jgi:sn-glycerol 3-phosphate transport system substrate-binding protein